MKLQISLLQVPVAALFVALLASPSSSNAAETPTVNPDGSWRVNLDFPVQTTVKAFAATGPPPECNTMCDPVKAVLGADSTCTPLQCCNASFERGLWFCLQCGVTATNVTDFANSQAQAQLELLRSQCILNGVTLPSFALPSNGPTATAQQTITNNVIPSPTATPSNAEQIVLHKGMLLAVVLGSLWVKGG